MLEPLSEWICDFCGEVIRSAEEGWVEWLSSRDDRPIERDFHIVHHASHSPRRPAGHCYHHDKRPGRSDDPLVDFLGPRGIVQIASFLDVGAYHDPENSGPRVSDFREFATLMRRLFVPYYEEARLYWDRALQDGFFAGANEIWMYLPKTLKEVVQRYGGDNG